MQLERPIRTALAGLFLVSAMSGCAVFAVADAAVSVGAFAVKTTVGAASLAVDATAAGVRAALPDDEPDDAPEDKR